MHRKTWSCVPQLEQSSLINTEYDCHQNWWERRIVDGMHHFGWPLAYIYENSWNSMYFIFAKCATIQKQWHTQLLQEREEREERRWILSRPSDTPVLNMRRKRPRNVFPDYPHKERKTKCNLISQQRETLRNAIVHKLETTRRTIPVVSHLTNHFNLPRERYHMFW